MNPSPNLISRKQSTVIKLWLNEKDPKLNEIFKI